jgi:hypothetical protein
VFHVEATAAFFGRTATPRPERGSVGLTSGDKKKCWPLAMYENMYGKTTA